MAGGPREPVPAAADGFGLLPLLRCRDDVRGVDVTDLDGPFSDVMRRIADARGGGEGAEGLVRLIVDGSGDIVELKIDPRAMRLTNDELSRAIREAFRAARQQANEQMQAAIQASGAPTEAAMDGLQADLRRLGADAQQRLEEFSALAEQLSSRLNRLG
jgi:DNA-binding protein YbaB